MLSRPCGRESMPPNAESMPSSAATQRGLFEVLMTLLTTSTTPVSQRPSPEELKLTRRASRQYGLFAPHLLRAALKQSFVMLRPDIQWKNPVMFVVEVVSTDLKAGDVILVETGQVIAGDGEIIEGVASVDESAITGESAPVVREAGGDRSGVTGGTRVLSDRILVRITAGAGKSFLDRMIALVEGAARQRTPNEIALSLVLATFTLIFLIVTATLWPIARHTEAYMAGLVGAAAVPSRGT